MSLETGKRLGAYEILGTLGAGGMGEVYRARDTRLDRDVAIKVLPAAFRENADARARFEREAKAVAALSHPNIMGIHDFGEHEGMHYAVVEFLEGETLADSLAAGPLPPRKAVEFARRIALGLAAAHDSDIVHRDIKPDNLFVTRDGQIKILDFGLARSATDPSSKVADDTPTFTHLTDAGTVLGTVNYMSPEQARGETAGPASDIFSLGTVLYEMVRGKRPFDRETVPETMTAILREDAPDFSEGPQATSPALQRIVFRCLEKQPQERFQSARDLAFALEAPSGVSTGATAAVHLKTNPRRIFSTWLPILTLAVGLAAGTWLGTRLNPAVRTDPVKITPVTFSGVAAHPAASPDGTTIAFAAGRGGAMGIWVKQLNAGGEAPLTTGNDSLPRFSPDGSTLLFIRAGVKNSSVYRVSVVGGVPRKLIDDAGEADWSPDGNEIVFVRSSSLGDDLVIVNVDGSDERVVASYPATNLTSPRWSPDGRHVALISGIRNNNIPLSVVLIEIESGETYEIPPRRPSVTGVAWSGSGEELVYGWSDDLLAGLASTATRVTMVNIETRETTDLFWANGLLQNQFGSRIDIVSPGRIVFGTMSKSQGLRERSLLDRGTTEALTLTDGTSVDRQPVYSPDGRKVLFSSNRGGSLDLWTVDLQSGILAQLTDDGASDWDPAFIGDGSRIVWSSDRGGNLEIWLAKADGTGTRRISNDGVGAENPTATPDGEWVVYITSNPAKAGLWKVRSDGTDAERIWEGNAYTPQISPDGRFVAFPSRHPDGVYMNVVELASGEHSRLVQPIAAQSRFTSVSIGRPRWFHDGRSIAFVSALDGRTGIVAQEFAWGVDRSSTRRRLIGFSAEWQTESFDISPDGSRITVSRFRPDGQVMTAEGVPFVTPARSSERLQKN